MRSVVIITGLAALRGGCVTTAEQQQQLHRMERRGLNEENAWPSPRRAGQQLMDMPHGKWLLIMEKIERERERALALPPEDDSWVQTEECAQMVREVATRLGDLLREFEGYEDHPQIQGISVPESKMRRLMD